MKTNPNQPISAFTELDEQGRPYQFYKDLTVHKTNPPTNGINERI